jgi:hypothetical protein
MKKETVKPGLLATLVITILIFTSCAPAYIPNVVNSPMFSNEGEFQGSVHTGLSGFDPQLAYAVTDHIGVMANGSFANWTSDSTDNFHKHQFFEAGLGYYTKVRTKGRLEVYGGYGFGKLETNSGSDLFLAYTKVNSSRVFIQPAIGIASNVFDGSFATRLVMLNLSQYNETNIGYFAEPVLTGKIGYKYVKVIGQFGISIPLNDTKIDFDYEPFIFSLGLQFNIGRMWDN